jgi:hypothetical protein
MHIRTSFFLLLFFKHLPCLHALLKVYIKLSCPLPATQTGLKYH